MADIDPFYHPRRRSRRGVSIRDQLTSSNVYRVYNKFEGYPNGSFLGWMEFDRRLRSQSGGIDNPKLYTGSWRMIKRSAAGGGTYGIIVEMDRQQLTRLVIGLANLGRWELDFVGRHYIYRDARGRTTDYSPVFSRAVLPAQVRDLSMIAYHSALVNEQFLMNVAMKIQPLVDSLLLSPRITARFARSLHDMMKALETILMEG